jgi:hypothetical protein
MPSFGVQGVGVGWEVDHGSRAERGSLGEGLGGGYRTPPNERDVSAANTEKGGVWGGRKGVQTASYPQAVFARAD